MTLSDTAIICGSAPKFWLDLERAQAIAPTADLVAVNMTGLFLAGARHVVSLHPPLLGAIRRLRESLDWCNGAPQPITHAHTAAPGVDHVWPLPPWREGGTSSLFATWVALQLGYQSVLLAGVPLDSSGRFYDPPAAPIWHHEEDHRAWRMAATDVFAGRVRSCSGGWTAELLGEP